MEVLDPRPMVQVVIITVGGTKYALIGPVFGTGEVSAIEFGEVMPMDVAAKMLSGEHRQWLMGQLQ